MNYSSDADPADIRDAGIPAAPTVNTVRQVQVPAFLLYFYVQEVTI